jgi:Zn ribbon nucleic-acid-binding protein
MDNGGEFQLTELVDEWEKEGIDLQPCVAYSHHQNGVAERVFQDIVNHTISVMHEANLPVELWYEVARTIVRIKNVMPHSHIGSTPYQASGKGHRMSPTYE